MPFKSVHRPVEIPIGPSIAYVPLSQGLYALIDAEDASRVGEYAWHAAFNSSSGHFYARRRAGNARLPLHDAILGELDGFTVDHVCSERTLDNRKCNLRHASKNLQVWNRKNFRNNTSGYVGVFWEAKKELWRAIIIHESKRIGLGRYKEKDDAARAYDGAAKRLRGEHARLNFPGG